jgi:hypothetical protein
MRPARYITALCSAGLTLLAAGFVLGQHTAPTDYHLVSEEVLATIDLVKEIDGGSTELIVRMRTQRIPPARIGISAQGKHAS